MKLIAKFQRLERRQESLPMSGTSSPGGTKRDPSVASESFFDDHNFFEVHDVSL